jgi:hypothetical protein
VLEAVDDFDTKQNAAVLSDFDRFAHALDCPVGEDSFVFAGQRPARPATVIDAGHDGAAHLLHCQRYVLKKGDALFARRGVFREHVHVGRQPNAVSESDTRIRRRFFERIPLRSAHAGDFWGVDLENVKAAFFGALDKQQRLRVPVLGPISEVYSNGVHKLMLMGAGDSHSRCSIAG